MLAGAHTVFIDIGNFAKPMIAIKIIEGEVL